GRRGSFRGRAIRPARSAPERDKTAPKGSARTPRSEDRSAVVEEGISPCADLRPPDLLRVQHPQPQADDPVTPAADRPLHRVLRPVHVPDGPRDVSHVPQADGPGAAALAHRPPPLGGFGGTRSDVVSSSPLY